MKFKKAKLKNLREIKKIFIEGVMDEFRLQYPNELNKKDIKKRIRIAERNITKDFKKGIKSKLEYWISVTEDDKIIGFGHALINKVNRKLGYFERVYAKKEYRRKGIGKKILKKLQKWLKDKKVKTIDTKVFIKNTPSMNLLKKIGFKIIPMVKGKDTLGLTKILK